MNLGRCQHVFRAKAPRDSEISSAPLWGWLFFLHDSGFHMLPVKDQQALLDFLRSL
jgi:hypothetical protein